MVFTFYSIEVNPEYNLIKDFLCRLYSILCHRIHVPIKVVVSN